MIPYADTIATAISMFLTGCRRQLSAENHKVQQNASAAKQMTWTTLSESLKSGIGTVERDDNIQLTVITASAGILRSIFMLVLFPGYGAVRVMYDGKKYEHDTISADQNKRFPQPLAPQRY